MSQPSLIPWRHWLAIIGLITAILGALNSVFGWFNAIVEFIKKLSPPGYDNLIRYLIIGFGICLIITDICNTISKSGQKYIDHGKSRINYQYSPTQRAVAATVKLMTYLLYVSVAVPIFCCSQKTCRNDKDMVAILMTKFFEGDDQFSKELKKFLKETIEDHMKISNIKISRLEFYQDPTEMTLEGTKRFYECYDKGVFTCGNAEFAQKSFSCDIYANNLNSIGATKKYTLNISDHIEFTGALVAASHVSEFIISLLFYHMGLHEKALEFLNKILSGGIQNSEFEAYCYLYATANYIQLDEKNDAESSLAKAKSMNVERKELKEDITTAEDAIRQMTPTISDLPPPPDWNIKSSETLYTPKPGKKITILDVGTDYAMPHDSLMVRFDAPRESEVQIIFLQDGKEFRKSEAIDWGKIRLSSIVNQQFFPQYGIPLKGFTSGKYAAIVMTQGQSDTLGFEIYK